jgi:AGZA family xanthine/uracil permease-like MFS transporter
MIRIMSPVEPPVMTGGSRGPKVDELLLFVNGTLMKGLALHANLDGATLLEEVRTAPKYRLHSIGDRHPGMYQVTSGGVAVLGELYRLSAPILDRVVRGEPPGLYVGSVELVDGRVVPGVLFDAGALQPTDKDISAHGGWRAYIARRAADP